MLEGENLAVRLPRAQYGNHEKIHMVTKYPTAVIGIRRASASDLAIIKSRLDALDAEPLTDTSFTFSTELDDNDLKEHLIADTTDSPDVVAYKCCMMEECTG